MEKGNREQRYNDLAEKWVAGTITPEEMVEYSNWLNTIDESEVLQIPRHIALSKSEHRKKIWQDIQTRLRQESQPPTAKWLSTPFKLVAAAVILTFLVLSVTWLYFIPPNTGWVLDAVTASKEIQPIDIPPGTTGAVLTLGNGKSIVLDTAANGLLDAAIVKRPGAIIFDQIKGASPDQYNTLVTPAARQQLLVLPDGTHAWLNAESSIRFPSSFTKKQRAVVITGEVYFEVTKDTEKPFVVNVNTASIEVLGTHFNVMAYANENALETTLLEGAVRFSDGNKQVLLRPGQQNRLFGNHEMKLVNNADIELVMAWKNGLQAFKKADISTIMRQVKRWYDVDVMYENALPDDITFSGEIPRDVPLSDLLRALETEHVHFRLDAGRRMITVNHQ